MQKKFKLLKFEEINKKPVPKKPSAMEQLLLRVQSLEHRLHLLETKEDAA